VLTKKKTCRYVINATGKNGETYFMTCDNKQEVKKWIKENNSKLNPKELKVTDKQKKLVLAKSLLLAVMAIFVIVEFILVM